MTRQKGGLSERTSARGSVKGANGAPEGRGVLAGHMARAMKDVRENLRLVQVVIEVADARLPATSRNPHLARAVGGKARILALNKADLAGEDATRHWVQHYRQQGLVAVPTDVKSGQGLGRLLQAAREAAMAARGGRPVTGNLRALLAGIPNVGKSSLINRLSGGAPTRTGAKPGVTRGKQWIRLEGLELLDLPGILPPFIRNQETLAILAIIAAIGPELVAPEAAALRLVDIVRQALPRQLEVFYGIESELGEGEAVLEAIGRRRGFRLSGGRVDTARAVEALLGDFRAGRLGRLTLEEPAPADPEPSPTLEGS